MLKKENKLVVLRLGLDRKGPDELISEMGSSLEGSREQDVILTLERAGRKVTEFRVTAGVLNVPITLDEARKYRYGEPDFKLPEDKGKALARKVNAYLAPGEPLWIQYDAACGYLPLVPWERLFESYLLRPILRLPYQALDVYTKVDRLSVAICASAPRAKSAIPIPKRLQRIVDRLLAADPSATVHLFSDANLYMKLKTIFVREAPNYKNIIIHDPDSAQRYAVPKATRNIEDSSQFADSPWLLWMHDTLQGESQALDAVFFLCHGYLSLDQGALALAESPLKNKDETLARFIGPVKLVSFLNAVGAWTLGIYTPEPNFSPFGSRLLIDQVARLRPGPVYLQEGGSAQPPGLESFLLGQDRSEIPMSEATSIYCHPDRAARSRAGELYSFNFNFEEDDLSAFTLARGESLNQLSSSASQSNWVLPAQRYLEQSASQTVVGSGQQQATKSPVQLGREDAQKFVANLLSEYLVSGTAGTTASGPSVSPGARADAIASGGVDRLTKEQVSGLASGGVEEGLA